MTILHVSDLRFGLHDRFEETDTHGSPARALLHWLEAMPVEVPRVDLVVVSGDLTESAMKVEFDQARTFIDRLGKQLGLTAKQIVVVPGNRDVNRKLCEAYFLEQEASGEEPERPYAKKWALYESFIRDLYGDPTAFSADLPYRVHNCCTPPVTVAALNTTVHESHQEHFGWCGDEQLEWFAEQLTLYAQTLRIAVVHHNVLGRAQVRDENLQDAERFTQVLGPHVDLVLHGHAHDGQADRLGDGPLVLGAGTPAQQADRPPDQVVNRCQVLQIRRDQITRWALRYRPDTRRWEGDTSASPDGTSWIREIPFRVTATGSPWVLTDLRIEPMPADNGAGVQPLIGNRSAGMAGNVWQGRDVHRDVNFHFYASTPLDEPPDVPAGGRRPPVDIGGPGGHFRPPGALYADNPSPDLLWEVLEVTNCRDDVRQVKVRMKGDVWYLSVYGVSGEVWAVGVVEGPLDRKTLDLFAERVHGPIRSRGQRTQSALVHIGPVDEQLTRLGLHKDILVKTWAEYQNLLDLSGYERRLKERLLADALYPQDLYLSQRYRTVDKRGRAAADAEDELAETVLDDLLHPGPRFVLVLGDPGFGKTFLTRRLTHLLLHGQTQITPVVVPLREAEKQHSLDEMVAGALASTSAHFQSDKFKRMFGGGRVVLLVDGYDEFAVRVGYDRAADQLRTFLRALDKRSKILLTTRPSHFRRKQEVVSQLFEEVADLDRDQRRVYELEPFHETQQGEFLRRWFELRGQDPARASQEADQWMAALQAVDNLPELARTPRMLSFMAEHLSLDQIEAAADGEGPVTAAGLYEMLVDKWLTTETEKFTRPVQGGMPGLTSADAERLLSPQERWRVAEELAYRLWVTGEIYVTEHMLEDIAGRVLDLPTFGLTAAQAAQEIGSRTLLVGDGDERYFAHQSIAEFLLARKLAEVLRKSDKPPELGQAELSELTARFLRDLAPDEGVRWLEALAAHPD